MAPIYAKDWRGHMNRVFIVIVHWNGIEDTLHCLTSLSTMLIPDKTTVSVVVVDNGSTTDPTDAIHRVYKDAVVIRLLENRGFSGGNTEGMKYAMAHGATHIWLLNNDTVVDRGALSLLRAFRAPNVGIAGSKIYFAPGYEFHHDRYTKTERGRVFWYAGGIIDWNNMYASHKGVDEVDHGQYDRVTSTQFVTGCSFMVKREVVEKVGYFDNRLYLYLEDVDYSLRTKQVGWSLVYYPDSVLWHVNAGSSGGAGKLLHDYYITRNRLMIGMRFAPWRTKAALIREAFRFLFGKNATKRKAVIDAAFGRWGKQYE